MTKLNRRQILRMGAAGMAAGGMGGYLWPQSGATAAVSPAVNPKDRKLLFVFCAYGGASIIDSFLPVVDAEVDDAELSAGLNVFPEQLVDQRAGSNIRSVKLLDNYAFYGRPADMGQLIARHGSDMAVIAHEVSSVNHSVAQQRALNGSGVNRGRTIMEAAALRYGGGMPLPNCNMASGGYVHHGTDESVPLSARHEIIALPELFATGTHGYKGLLNAPSSELIERARAVRDRLDETSAFSQTFVASPRLRRYLEARRAGIETLEGANLIEQLLLLDPNQLDKRYGLEQSPLAAELRQTFPALDEDNLQAQLALGFLTAYYGMSASVTVGLRTEPVVHDDAIVSSPIAFDFSHNMHRVVQSLMWSRISEQLDSLITLLKSHDYMGDPELGKMWDRSLIYVATEFGRDKRRPADAPIWGTSHHLNNGSLLISPMLRGNRVYGGVDPKTCLTYGFDPATGEPDPDRVWTEGDVYSLVAHALDIDFPGRVDFDAVVR